MEREISGVSGDDGGGGEEEEAARPVIMSEDDVRNQAFLNGRAEDGENKEKVKLKEPRDLYSTASLQHVPKWPIECQVIPEKIRHNETISSKPEPFHVPSSTENQPKPVGEEMGTVIFNYQPKLSVDYVRLYTARFLQFCRASAGGSDELQFFETDANTLKFESRFESGNLAKAIKVTNVYYELYLRPDMYTDRHSQWFYFRIQNTKENIVYRFSIVNLSKPDSLYRYGLKPLMYSEKDAQLNNIGWLRCGHNIAYYKNDLMADDNNAFYTLTFTLKFRYSNDTVYIAQCYPFTYTKLQNYLAEIEANEKKSEFCQQRLLCRSLAGNNVYVLTITSPDNYSQENVKKPVIVISARVHPGETQSSYMMKGIIDFLTSNFRQAKDLRDRFIFKLIPMLNPDGVIVGNSRCCLLGQDLNRQYRTVLREAFPQIYHTKVMMRRLMEENGIYLYCDLHGHSRRNNVFMYGCENKRVPEKRLTEQIFPLMMQKNAADKFSFQNCKFKIQRSKEGTGRVFAWTLGVHLSYTIEISLGGSTQPSRHQTHFNTYDYEAAGRHFCETLLDYSDTSTEKERLREKILQKLQENGSTADDPQNIPISDYSSISHSETEESSDDNETKTNKKTLKRKNSIRRQQSMPSRSSRNKPNKEKPKLLKIERSVLSITKASVATVVEEVRTSTVKVRRLEDGESKTVRVAQGDQDYEDSIARLNRFKRRSKRVAFRIPGADRGSSNLTLLSTKCASILFDDPFNPPSREGGPSKLMSGEDNGVGGTVSLSEDECDDSDGAFKNQRYFPNSSTVRSEDLVDELAQLRLSPPEKRQNPVESLVETNMLGSVPLLDTWRPILKVPTPITDPSVYAKSVRKKVTIEKQKTITIERPRSKSTTSIDLPDAKQITQKLAWRSTIARETSYRSHTAQPTGLAPHQQQRRVSWTGVSSASTSSTLTRQAKLKTHQETVASVPAKRENNFKRNALKKSKSVGDKLDETAGNNGEIHQQQQNKKKKKKHKRNKAKKQ